MTDTGFIARNGTDLVTIFEPGSGGPATNFIGKDGNDLNTRFAPFVSGGSVADVTGYTVGTTDLSNLFMKKNTSIFNAVDINFLDTLFNFNIDQVSVGSNVLVNIQHLSGSTQVQDLNASICVVDIGKDFNTAIYDVGGNRAYTQTYIYNSKTVTRVYLDVSFTYTKFLFNTDYTITITAGSNIYKNLYYFMPTGTTKNFINPTLLSATTKVEHPSYDGITYTYNYTPNFEYPYGTAVTGCVLYCSYLETKNHYEINDYPFNSNSKTICSFTMGKSSFSSKYPMYCSIQFKSSNKIVVTDVYQIHTVYNSFVDLTFLNSTTVSFKYTGVTTSSSIKVIFVCNYTGIDTLKTLPDAVNNKTYTLSGLPQCNAYYEYKIIWVKDSNIIHYGEKTYVGNIADYTSNVLKPITTTTTTTTTTDNSFDIDTYKLTANGMSISCRSISNQLHFYYSVLNINWSGESPYTIKYLDTTNLWVEGLIGHKTTVTKITELPSGSPDAPSGSSFYWVRLVYEYDYVFYGFIIVKNNIVISAYELLYYPRLSGM